MFPVTKKFHSKLTVSLYKARLFKKELLWNFLVSGVCDLPRIIQKLELFALPFITILFFFFEFSVKKIRVC